MRISTLVALLLPMAGYPIARLAQDGLHPRVATWVLTCAALVLATTGTFTLGVVALHAAFRLTSVQTMMGLSGNILVAREHTTIVASVVATATLGVLLTMTMGFVARHARTLARSFDYARSLPGDEPVVIMDDELADAYSVPGSPSRIVVSTGMLAALDADQQRAVVAHEDSHLRHRHYAFTSITRIAAIANPLVRPVATAAEYTMERWADEDAARTLADRRLVASAVSRAALARKGQSERRANLFVLNIVTARRRRDRLGPVPRRVAALLGPEPTNSWAVVIVTIVVLALATGYAVGAGAHLHALVSLARTAH